MRPSMRASTSFTRTAARSTKQPCAKWPTSRKPCSSRNDVKGEELGCFIPHQANKRIILSTADRLGMDLDRVIINIDRFGNTTAGTIPLAMNTAIEEGRIKKGRPRAARQLRRWLHGGFHAAALGNLELHSLHTSRLLVVPSPHERRICLRPPPALHAPHRNSLFVCHAARTFTFTSTRTAPAPLPAPPTTPPSSRRSTTHPEAAHGRVFIHIAPGTYKPSASTSRATARVSRCWAKASAPKMSSSPPRSSQSRPVAPSSPKPRRSTATPSKPTISPSKTAPTRTPANPLARLSRPQSAQTGRSSNTAASSAIRTRSSPTSAGNIYVDSYIEGGVDFIFGNARCGFRP